MFFFLFRAIRLRQDQVSQHTRRNDRTAFYFQGKVTVACFFIYILYVVCLYAFLFVCCCSGMLMCAVLCGFPYLRSMATQFHHTLSTTECCLAVSSNSELFPHLPSFPPLPLLSSPLLSSPLLSSPLLSSDSHSLSSLCRLLSESKVFVGLGFPYDGQCHLLFHCSSCSPINHLCPL